MNAEIHKFVQKLKMFSNRSVDEETSALLIVAASLMTNLLKKAPMADGSHDVAGERAVQGNIKRERETADPNNNMDGELEISGEPFSSQYDDLLYASRFAFA